MNDVAEAGFLDPHVIADPFAFYQAALAKGPVVRVAEGMYLVLSHELCAKATAQVDVFSNNFSAALSADPDVEAELAKGWPQVDTLLTADPPTHTRFRKLVNLAFSMKRLAAIEDHVRGLAIELIERMADAGEGDFVRDFAVSLPVAMIAS